jgi:hypothetical protein
MAPGIYCDVRGFAALGLGVIGLVSVSCIGFGIYEISVHDSTFMNDGLGEVLTVLGLYFSIPYLIILAAFFSRLQEWRLPAWCQGAIAPSRLLLIAVVVLFVIQQAVSDAYLVILVGSKFALLIIVADVAIFGAILYLKLSPVSAALYTVLYSSKLALQWNRAYLTNEEAFFGRNGVSTMLFLTLPIVQFPLYTSAMSENHSAGVVDIFVENSNLFLSHLLHSLDTIAMYLFCFVNPAGSALLEPCPAPFRWLVLIAMLIAFSANNVAVPYLFFRRRGDTEAELQFLPKRIIEVTRLIEGDGEDGNDDVNRSRQRKMFQYMLLMLFACDVPFFFLRCELWRRNYFGLDVFVAKNLKDFVDVCMLLMKSDSARERDV